MLSIVGEQTILFNRAKLLALTREQKNLISAFNMSNFRVLNEYSAGNVLSITYSYDYKMKVGGANILGTNLVN